MKRDWLLYLVIFSLALNLGTIGTIVYLRLQDQAEASGRAETPPLRHQELWANLNLDEGQRTALRQGWPEHFQRIRGFRKELAQRRQELFDLVKQESPSWPALQGKVKEISETQGRLEEEVLRFFLEMQKQLKPEQKASLMVLLERRLTPMMGGRRGGRGMMGPGRGMGPDCPMPGGSLTPQGTPESPQKTSP